MPVGFGGEQASLVLVAVAVGSSLGLQLEYTQQPPLGQWLESMEQLEELLPGMDTYYYSGDAELMILLAETIVESCGFNPSLFARKMAERAEIDNPLRLYDTGVAEVIAAIRRGMHWIHAARLVYGGAGNYAASAAVRVAPIPLFYTSRRLVESMAEAQAAVTHANPLGVEAARLQALAIRYSMEGLPPAKLAERLAAETGYEEFRARLHALGSLLSRSPTEVARVLGNGAPAYEALPAAVYAHARGEGDPAKTLLYALSLGGEASSIAPLAAAMAAAYTGSLRGIPQRILRRVEGVEYIAELGRRLYERSVECHAQQNQGQSTY